MGIAHIIGGHVLTIGVHPPVYGKYDILSVVPWLHGPPVVYVSSAEMMAQILGYGDNFDKPFSAVKNRYVYILQHRTIRVSL